MRARVVVMLFAVALAGACSGGGHKGNANATTTSRSVASSTVATSGSSASSTTAPATDGSATPALVGINNIVASKLTAPVWYLANAGAAAGSASVLTDSQTTTTIVTDDGRYAVVRRAQDAVNPAGIGIVDVKTGQEVDRLDIDDPRVVDVVWSPDDEAVLVQGTTKLYLHKVSGATASGTISAYNIASHVVFSTRDGVVTAVTNGAFLVVDDSVGHFTAAPHLSALAQLSEQGQPRAVYSIQDPSSAAYHGFRLTTGQSGKDLGADFPTTGTPTVACGRFLVWDHRTFSAGEWRVYDITNDLQIDVGPAGHDQMTCPILSPDGKALAFHFDDGVYVVDLATAKRTRVTREGRPIAWSSDSQSLAVVGNGVFVVRADGSGGKQANVTPRTNTQRIACRVADSGLAVFNTDTGFALFDVGANSARSMAVENSSGLDVSCSTSADGKWFLSGNVLVDVANGKATVLHYPDVEGLKTIRWFRWYGDQVVTDPVISAG